MKTIATIEARMASSRLPGKVLKEIVGKPMLGLLVERIKRAKRLDGIVVATTVNEQDKAIEELAEKLGVGCYRGSEDDVLGRVLEAARAYQADLIVELTGDNPLVDSILIDAMVEFYLNNNYDYVANTQMRHSLKWKEESTFPVGSSIQIFSTELLDRVSKTTIDPVDREHVTFFIYEHPEMFKLGAFRAEGEFSAYRRPEIRLSVDFPEDLQLIRRIFEGLYPSNPSFTLADVIKFLDSNPQLKDINARVVQKLAYE
jgi:spore coat polysaccharide biosynthesis protein SpsF